MSSFMYRIKYVAFIIKLLCIVYPFCVFSLPNYVEDREIKGRGIQLDISPPGIRELAAESVEYIGRRGRKAEELLEINEKITSFLEKYPVIYSYIRGENDEKHIDRLNMLPCSEDEKKVPKKHYSLLSEYTCLVKKYHNQLVSLRDLKDFEKMFHRVEDNPNTNFHEKIYERVILRYPEYKRFDKKSIILFGLLLLPNNESPY